MRVKIVTFVPLNNADAVREALGKAGAGQIGGYSFYSYSVLSKGRFTPSDNANPHIGSSRILEVVEEERVEVECDRVNAKTVITTIKSTHPYEEAAFDIYPLLEETDL